VSLIYLIISLPILKRKELLRISKEQFFLRAYQSLGKSELNDLNLLLLKERIDFFINLQAEAVAKNPLLKKGEIRSIYRKSEVKHFTQIGCNIFPKWIYEPVSPNLMLRLWYKEVFSKANSHFFKEWARFSLNLEDIIVGLISKKSKLSRDDFLLQMDGSFSSVSALMKKRYNHDAYLGLKTKFDYSTLLLDILSISSAESLEKKINDIRIQAINKIKPMDYFSLDFLVAYYFELSIYTREASFDINCGRKILDKILTSTTEAA